jgi:hypothetical protein
MNEQNYIENIRVYKVANGHVVQIKLVGISTEHTYICGKEDGLVETIDNALTALLEEKH